MIPLYTSKDIKRIDTYYVDHAKVPALALMETAASNATVALRAYLSAGRKKILIVCGGGNNGGDGLVMARLLASNNEVTVLFNSDVWEQSALCKANFLALPDTVTHHPTDWLLEQTNLPDFDVVIDALVGVGGNHQLRFPFNLFTRLLNESGGMKVAVDVPTGLNANTGQRDADTFRADVCLTMVGPKPGMVMKHNSDVCGKIIVVPIGTQNEFERSTSHCFVLTPGDVRTILPKRSESTSKFDLGRVGVIGGSLSMRGAPSLTAHAALATGAGLVELFAPSIHPLTPREIICHTLVPDGEGGIAIKNQGILMEQGARCSVLAVGPGVGSSDQASSLLEFVVNELKGKSTVVLDADGLRFFRGLRKPLTNCIITPHSGEFARLSTIDRETVEHDPIYYAENFATTHGCIVHLKGPTSVTTDGTKTFLTVNGNAGLSKAGSGDVLTGIVAGLLAQGVEPLIATALAAYLHGACAEYCVRNSAVESIMPSQIISALATVLNAE